MSKVAPILYRRILKTVQGIDKYYKGNADHVVRSIFGIRISLQTFERGGFGSNSMDIARKVFRSCAAVHPPKDETSASDIVDGHQQQEVAKAVDKGFWFLRQCGFAIPLKEHDDKYVDRKAIIEFAGSASDSFRRVASLLASVEVRAVMPVGGAKFSLPRHCIPSDPFWLLQLRETQPFPFAKEFLLLQSAAEKGFETPSSTKPRKDLGEASSSTTTVTSSPRVRLSVLPKETIRNAFAALPRQTSTITNGIIEVVCRTEYAGEHQQFPRSPNDGQGDGENAEEDQDDHSPADQPLPSSSKSNVYQYFITIRHLGKRESSSGSSGRHHHQSRTPPASSRDVLLLSRHWVFTDLDKGVATEVSGSGVIGEFPVLSPGDSHTYASGTIMEGMHGTMGGTLQMVLLPTKDNNATAATTTASSRKSSRKAQKKKAQSNGGDSGSSGATFFDAHIRTTRLSPKEDCTDFLAA